MFTHIKILVFVSILLTSLLSIAKPGELVSLTHLQDVDAAEVAAGRKIFCPATVNIKKAFGFKIYKVEYSTTDLKGQPVVTAGLIMVPQVAEKLPLFVYHHGDD